MVMPISFLDLIENYRIFHGDKGKNNVSGNHSNGASSKETKAVKQMESNGNGNTSVGNSQS